MRTSMPSSLTTRCLLAFPLVLGAVGAASVGSATTLPGKGPATSECYVVLQATGTKAASAPNKLVCQDGDPTCDQDGDCHNGSCTFKVQACPNQAGLAPCTPGSLTSLTAKAKGVPLPAPPSLSGSQCGGTLDVLVSLKGKKKNKPGKTKVVLVATAASGKPKKDRDTDTLVCTPFPAGQTCPLRGPVTTTTLPTNVVCEPLVRDGQGIPGTYLLLSVKGPYLCQQSAQQNRFGPCNCSGGESVCADPAHCGPGQETCVQTPFAVADGQALAFPPGSIKTVFSVAAEDPAPSCSHTACVTCGNPDTPCPGIPGCQVQGNPAGCIRTTCCDTPGFALPTFKVNILGGVCSRLDMYSCGFGVVNTSNPQVGDNEITKIGDSSDPGPDCQYGTADDPPKKPCVVTGVGSDIKGKIVRTVGNQAFDANGIQYRLAIPALSTTWMDSQSPPGQCLDGSTFDSEELLVTQLILNAEFTTAGATAGFTDMNGDHCALAGSGFTRNADPGPYTLGSPPAAPQPYDGSSGSVAVAAGIALSGHGPLYDIGFTAVLPDAPITRLPTQSCTCIPVAGCPE